jgi:hypothetical protein
MATVGTHADYENEVNRDPEGTNEVRKCDVLLMTQSQVSHLGQSVLFCSYLVLLLSFVHHYQIESRKSDEKQSKEEESWRDFEQPGTHRQGMIFTSDLIL